MENIIYFGKNILTGDIRKLKLSTDTSTSSYGIARYVDADGNDWGQEGLPNLGMEIIAVRTSGTDCIAKINGCNVDLDDIAPLMDNDIREDVHADLAPCEPQQFADEYCKRHLAKFGKDFLGR